MTYTPSIPHGSQSARTLHYIIYLPPPPPPPRHLTSMVARFRISVCKGWQSGHALPALTQAHLTQWPLLIHEQHVGIFHTSSAKQEEMHWGAMSSRLLQRNISRINSCMIEARDCSWPPFFTLNLSVLHKLWYIVLLFNSLFTLH